MTEMKRVTISVPDDLDSRIFAMRKTDDFVSCSYSEIVRRLLEAGLRTIGKEKGG